MPDVALPDQLARDVLRLDRCARLACDFGTSPPAEVVQAGERLHAAVVALELVVASTACYAPLAGSRG